MFLAFPVLILVSQSLFVLVKGPKLVISTKRSPCLFGGATIYGP